MFFENIENKQKEAHFREKSCCTLIFVSLTAFYIGVGLSKRVYNICPICVGVGVRRLQLKDETLMQNRVRERESESLGDKNIVYEIDGQRKKVRER